ncbi:MAG: hypothetical protein DHS20C18_52260 [Saprospiraceae bacterium]|nr:MAG: hypothetical protein DHS20C18_52260 [Saprospiraceae bacterium]
MKSTITLFFALLISVGLCAQTTATFEVLNPGPNAHLNDAGVDGGFMDGNIFLPNDFNDEFGSWSGWAISTATDNQTPGYLNQYSSITGRGQDGSETYAISYVSPQSTIYLTGAAAGGVVEGLYLTNSTFAYYSMLEGDGFTKKFGGETGDDPDIFLLTIKKYLNGEVGTDSVDFYLADYRFEDNSQDYIVNEWTYVDLRILGNADSLLFTMASTDTGVHGINTPTYFCVDNLTTTDMPTATEEWSQEKPVNLFPNPTRDLLTVERSDVTKTTMSLWSLDGQFIRQEVWSGERNTLDMAKLAPGMYLLKLNDGERSIVRKIVKK